MGGLCATIYGIVRTGNRETNERSGNDRDRIGEMRTGTRETIGIGTRETKRETGGARAYMGTGTITAVATVSDSGSVTGSAITGTVRNSNDPAEWDRFNSEFRNMFADRDPVIANPNRNREANRNAWDRDRDRELFAGSAKQEQERIATNRVRSVVRDRSGSIVSRKREPAETLRTYTITIGIGSVPVSDIGEWIAGTTNGNGFQLIPHVGYWENEQERSVSILFQGTERIAIAIMETIAERFPTERFAHVAITEPETHYLPIAEFRNGKREAIV